MVSLDDKTEELLLASELADLGEAPPPEEWYTFEKLAPGEVGSDVVHQSTEEKQVKRVSVQGDRIVVEFPFDRKKVNALQPLKESIEDWAFDRFHRKEWSYPLVAAPSVFQALRGFHDLRYSVNASRLIKRQYQLESLERQIQVVEKRWHMLEQLAALEAARPYLDGAPVANGQRLFRHQREAVQRMIEARDGRFILAHHMELGKSRSALIAAQAYDVPIWVIAPAGTLINWQREAAAAGVEITLFSWAKLPEPPVNLDYVLITDEAHFAQTGEDSLRGRGFLQLADAARAVYRRARRRFWSRLSALAASAST